MIPSLEVRRVCAKVRRVTPQRSHFRRKFDLESPGDRLGDLILDCEDVRLLAVVAL